MAEASTTQVTSSVGSELKSDLGQSLAGKYMTFRLANEVYGLELLRVREIIGMMDITRVARTANYIRGVINLRGKVIPVLDQKLKLELGNTEITDQTVIIVVQIAGPNGDLTMGILVDEVLEVLNVESKQIEPPPDFGSGGIDADFILGVGKQEKNIVFLLDIQKVLTNGDASCLAKAAEA